MKDYKYDQFTKLVGDQVEVVDSEGNTGVLSITDVKKAQPDDDRWSAFSIHFKNSESDFTLTPGTYLFRHETAGERSLYLSPLSTVDYESAITIAKHSGSAGNEL